MKAKKKEGLSCLFEIAGQKKGLLVLAGLLSAGSAVCMLVPYWAIYEILKELLSHGGNPAWCRRGSRDTVGMDGIRRTGWRTGIAVCCPDVLPCRCFPYPVRLARPSVRTYR